MCHMTWHTPCDNHAGGGRKLRQVAHLCAVEGVKLQAELVCRVQGLDVEVILWKVPVCDGVEQVVRGVAVPHLELPGGLRLVIRHELRPWAAYRTVSKADRVMTHGSL